ncbi:MAG: hypothetical protein LBR49_04425, partial [Tannerella sp.]|nr:hypothetical protein [Tannerella sp.]
MNILRKLFCGLIVLSAVSSFSQSVAGRWTEARANEWYAKQGWLTGINYIPGDAINFTAMFDKTTFNPELIDRELAVAEELGYNVVRTFLPYIVYADDPKYFLKTLDKFIALCDK